MKIKGTVDTLVDHGDRVKVTLTNCRRVKDAGWREYMPNIEFKVGHHSARTTYFIGQSVQVTIKAI